MEKKKAAFIGRITNKNDKQAGKIRKLIYIPYDSYNDLPDSKQVKVQIETFEVKTK